MLTQSVLDTLTAGLYRDMFGFVPELLVCIAIVLMLVLRLFRGMARSHMSGIAMLFVLLALLLTAIHCASLWWLGPHFAIMPNLEIGAFDVLTDLGKKEGAFGGMM